MLADTELRAYALSSAARSGGQVANGWAGIAMARLRKLMKACIVGVAAKPVEFLNGKAS